MKIKKLALLSIVALGLFTPQQSWAMNYIFATYQYYTNSTILISTIEKKQHDFAKSLIESGAYLDTQDKRSETALMETIRNEYDDLSILLIKNWQTSICKIMME